MSRLPVRLAVTYSDRTESLIRGEVGVRGADLAVTVSTTDQIFKDVWGTRDFDVAEMSLATYCIQVSRGVSDFIAIPVFPSRMFRHSSLYVPAGSSLDSLHQLANARVGVPDYAMTAAVWVRYVLRSEHGIGPEEITWAVGGLEEPSSTDRIEFRAPSGVKITRLVERASLVELLRAGKLDVLLTPRAPVDLRRGSIRRLLKSPKEEERAWFQRSGLFPIMHTVVVRRELLESNEWLAAELLAGFAEAKRRAWERLQQTDYLPYGLVWCVEESLEQEALFRGEHWPYGVQANHQVLSAFVGALDDQGLTERKLSVHELFAETSLVSQERNL